MAKSIKSFFSGLFGTTARTHKKSTEAGDYELLSDKVEAIPTSRVYQGKLKDGAQIAVKRLKCDMFKDVGGFCETAQFLGSFQHKNILPLKGYCAEGRERMVVYDYMQNSSLYAHLHGDLEKQGTLDWQKRVKIAVGCAQGLAYLHNHSAHPLVHGDIKSTNVLLSTDFEPRIVDFGMTYLLKDGIPRPRGAFGYAAPEDLKGEEDITKRSDVFSFGILLLELISGKSPAEKLPTNSGKLSIVEWAQNLIIGGKFDDLIDPRLNGNYNHKELEMLLNAAVLCGQEKPENRLSMQEVVAMLDTVIF